MQRAWLFAVLASASCYPGVPSKPTLRAEAATVLLDADAPKLERLLADSVTYAGLFFADPACAAEFPTARTISGTERAELARCLATLPLRASRRTDETFGVGVYEYAPGIEIEAKFHHSAHGSRLVWIGYAGRRDGQARPPTITRALLEANRIEGDPIAAPAPRDLGEPSQAWFDVCISPAGAVTSVEPIEATSPRAVDAFTAAIAQWKFHPIVIAGRASHVCAQLHMIAPRPNRVARAEQLPASFALPPGAFRVPEGQLHPIGQSELADLTPDDDLQALGISRLSLAFRYCVEPDGHTSDIQLLEPSGSPAVDAWQADALGAWTFHPLRVDGVPIKTCSTMVFR